MESGSTIKRTTTTTTTHNVIQSAQPYSLIINRTSSSLGTPGSSRTTTRSVRGGDSRDGGAINFTEGSYSLMTASGVNAVKSTREQEKKDMTDLNDRFANYIDKVRNLEAQNRKLADELDKLKTKWGNDTVKIKAMYQAELDEARRQLDDAEREKARLEIKVATLEELIEELRQRLLLAQAELVTNKERFARNNQIIIEYENEIQMLRKQLESYESEREKDKKRVAELEELLGKVREDLDNETLEHIDAENRRQTLEEQIEFLKSIHDQEMKELAALAYRDTSPESRDFWKNEMAQAIREIEQMYADKMEIMKIEMEKNNNLKLNELRTGVTRQNVEATKGKEDAKDLRDQVADIRARINDLDTQNAQLLREIEALRRAKEDRERELEAENASLRGDASDLRSELDGILRELQSIMDSKMGLELEIAAYRKLLEGEESRAARLGIGGESYSSVQMTSSSLFSSGGGGGAAAEEEETGSQARGEMSAKTTYQRAAKGSVAISDCTPDGRLVRLENTGRKEENIAGWKIRRVVDGATKLEYELSANIFSKFAPGSKIGIWGKGMKSGSAPATDIEMDEMSWGMGVIIVTSLFNTEGDERASLTSRTTYS